MKLKFFSPFYLTVLTCLPVWAQAPEPPPSVPLERAVLTPMKGQVVSFRSGLYGDDQLMALCATDNSPAPKPLLVDLIPGTIGNLERAARDCEQICEFARRAGLSGVALRPVGRGPGTVYQGYGEVDVYEAVEAVKRKMPIDSERISVTGASMGGAATWYHASHYPDFWSAAAPYCGYCDYKLWEKPGGTTFHRQEWEEASWIGRDAAYRPENLLHIALRITHGEWDRAVGGGVPVEHSRQMHRKLDALGIPNTYIEVPEVGHNVRSDELWEKTVVWLLQQKRVVNPDSVSLVVHTLRHQRSFWLAVEQQQTSGGVSRVQAKRDSQTGRIRVVTDNVRRLSIGPVPGTAKPNLELDTGFFPDLDLSRPARFLRSSNGAWAPAGGPLPDGEKRPGLSGPFGDLFIGPTVIIYGATGTKAENHFNEDLARGGVRFFNQFNGGVHRGGILGQNTVQIPWVSDVQVRQIQSGEKQAVSAERQSMVVDRALLERANLFFIGNFGSNAELARLAGKIPVKIEARMIELGGKKFYGEHLALYAILPHPDGRRYVALLSGAEPDAICWGSHINWQLLPDYLVFDRDQVIKWGFFDNLWRASAP